MRPDSYYGDSDEMAVIRALRSIAPEKEGTIVIPEDNDDLAERRFDWANREAETLAEKLDDTGRYDMTEFADLIDTAIDYLTS